MAVKIPVQLRITISQDLKEVKQSIGDRAFHEWIDDLVRGIRGGEHVSTHIGNDEVVVNLKVPDYEIYSL